MLVVGPGDGRRCRLPALVAGDRGPDRVGDAVDRSASGACAAGPCPGWLAESLGVSFAAEAATLPVVLLAFGRLALLAPAVNLLVVPLVPLAMAAGTVALVAGVAAHCSGCRSRSRRSSACPAWLVLGADRRRSSGSPRPCRSRRSRSSRPLNLVGAGGRDGRVAIAVALAPARTAVAATASSRRGAVRAPIATRRSDGPAEPRTPGGASRAVAPTPPAARRRASRFASDRRTRLLAMALAGSHRRARPDRRPSRRRHRPRRGAGRRPGRRDPRRGRPRRPDAGRWRPGSRTGCSSRSTPGCRRGTAGSTCWS